MTASRPRNGPRRASQRAAVDADWSVTRSYDGRAEVRPYDVCVCSCPHLHLSTAAPCTAACHPRVDRRVQHAFRRPLADRAHRRQPAAAHHREPVAEAEQLRQVGADHQHRLAAASAASAMAVVDLRLAADVDAARRLVEQQDVGVLVQQPPERDLLLVAARQRPHGLVRARRALIAEVADPAPRGAALLRQVQPAAPASTPRSRVSVMLSATDIGSASPSPLRSSLR